MKARYEVRVFGMGFIVWDRVTDAPADELNGWQFASRTLADDAAAKLNWKKS